MYLGENGQSDDLQTDCNLQNGLGDFGLQKL